MAHRSNVLLTELKIPTPPPPPPPPTKKIMNMTYNNTTIFPTELETAANQQGLRL
jgi:hypothetical protein